MTEYFLTGAEPDEVWPLIRAFHYSHRMPSNIQHIYAAMKAGGLFGDFGDVVAAVAFSIPPTRWSEPVLELSRLVRRDDLQFPLSKLIAFAFSNLRTSDFGLVVSFADWTQRHHGGIYQASGFNYGGVRERAMDGVVIDGAFIPGRSCNSTYGTRSPEKLAAMMPAKTVVGHYDEGKHLYWRTTRPSGNRIAKTLGLKSLPFPKPSAARPLDERSPLRASVVQPHGAAPTILDGAA